MNPMSMPLAQNGVSRPGARDETNVTSLLSIGADAKARIRILVVDDEHTLRESCATVLRTALTTNHDTIVIVMTGNPSVESSVDALRQGAFDYLPKPFSASHLQVLIGRAVHTL